MRKLDPEQKEKLEWAKEQFDTGLLVGNIPAIKTKLLREGLDPETIRIFGKYYIEIGLEQGWLIEDLGF